ncbi:ParB N-terminal domain-containing protein [Vibrio tasmaniensis]|uniref:hypothetical protein n=1 Tax=Vibrio tasmaniensis TaxID=212663 RepID=UPI001119B9C3|nr:hypothetical protein [Vibrio tasmaniensis]
MANDRLKKIAQLNASKAVEETSSTTKPTLESTSSSHRKPQAFMTGNERQTTMTLAQGKLASIEASLNEGGINLQEFLTETKKLDFTKTGREIKSIDGTSYRAIQRTLSYEDIVTLVRVDVDNVREQSSRNTTQLNKMNDEIEFGMQISPVLAYQGADGLLYVVDGSCRTEIAIDKKVGLDFEILDQIPTPETITWLVASSDIKTSFNYYEKGKLYSRLMEVNEWSAYKLEQERLYEKSDISLSLAIYSMPNNLKSLFANYAFSSRDAKFLRKLIGIISESKEFESALTTWIDESRSELEGMPTERINKEVIARLKEWVPVTSKPTGINKQPQTWAEKGKAVVSYQLMTKSKSKIELTNARPEEIAKIEEFFKKLFG